MKKSYYDASANEILLTSIGSKLMDISCTLFSIRFSNSMDYPKFTNTTMNSQKQSGISSKVNSSHF